MSGKYIKELVKGKTPTLLTTSKGNEVIKALNVLANIEIFASDSDKVEYTEDGVYIYYEKEGYEISGEFELLDSADITKKWKVTVSQGAITSIEYEDSNYELKAMEFCEDGETVTRNFLVEKE